MGTAATFFGSAQEDDQLEEVNQIFWRSLLGHARAELERSAVETILDVGCHHGGLLEMLARHFRPRRLFGLEPLERARQKARFRLTRQAGDVVLLPPEQWTAIPEQQIDLLTCHEVLHLVADLDGFMTQVARVLSTRGSAYLVLGSHAENPLWPTWKAKLTEQGHETHDHAPFDILAAASRIGLHGALRPLRRDGWVIYDPIAADYRFPSTTALFDHHYRHKLLFRLRLEEPR